MTERSVKLAFYTTGSSAKVLRRCMDYLDGKVAAICPNFQAYAEAQKEPRFSGVEYIYEGFNEIFDNVDVAKFCEEYSSINLSEILMVDKTHFKKKSNKYQLRYVCAMGRRMAEAFKKTQPEYLFFPIIETIDAMLAYRMAPLFGIKPIIYCHARFSDRSYFSGSHLELLPAYLGSVDRPESDRVWAEQFIQNYRSKPGPFKIHRELPGGEVYADRREDLGAFGRLLRNIRLKSSVEKHNQMIKIWINFQVRFQQIFLPVRSAIFSLVERFYIKPEAAPANGYDFFPLHCSPEASINVPAPFYIDQLRVVDRILLHRSVNMPLVLKEHPAMYGFREKGFFRALKGRPFVSVVPRSMSSIELIRNASTVYSVTGTACLEAFLLGVNWVQFANNFLHDWVTSRREASRDINPVEFIRDVLSVSGSFVLYSPGRSFSFDQILFAKANVKALCDHLALHMERSRAMSAS